MLTSKEASFCYPVLPRLSIDPSKYNFDSKNPDESQRRMAKLTFIQTLSDAVCQELDIEKVELRAIGSVERGCAKPNSDLDICIEVQANHPLLSDEQLRQIYSAKMQFLLANSKKIDFPVSIVFVSK